MHDGGQELAELRRRMNERAYESELAFQRWQCNAAEQLAGAESTSAVLDEPLTSSVPSDAPRQYRDVLYRFETGGLDWQAVMSGDTEDEGGRAMSMWMDRRLQQIEHLSRLVRQGATFDDAYAEATRRAGSR